MKKLKLYGNSDSAERYPIRDFLKRSPVEFEWIDLNHSADKQASVL